jgi:flagellar basal-body rod protein FlgC
MAFKDMFAASAISASGMSAERLRMEVTANNLANAHSTRSANGGPFRRQDLVFQEVLDNAAGGKPGSAGGLRGVAVVDRVEDMSELPRVYLPGHPDADADGMVTMPNVSLPIEMVNLLTASRAYEANVRAAQTFRQLGEQALSILRG